MALPYLEGEIIFPSAVSVTIAGSAQTIPAGSYYMATLLTAWVTAATAAGVTTPAAAIANTTDSATGKVTLSAASAFTVTWTNTYLRDLLGFTGNLGSATSHTGSNQARTVFLPNHRRADILGPEDGATTTACESYDYTFRQAPSGASRSLGYTKRTLDDTLGFPLLTSAKTWITQETTTNESLQKFWRDVIAKGSGIRYAEDRSTPTTYVTYRVVDGGTFQPTRAVANSTAAAWNVGWRVVARGS